LIKGYQGVHGKLLIEVSKKFCLTIEKDSLTIKSVVFGADAEVVDHVINNESIYNGPSIQIKWKISHQEVLVLMGNAIVYCHSNWMEYPTMPFEAILGCFTLQLTQERQRRN
jgi:hypothetical protein